MKTATLAISLIASIVVLPGTAGCGTSGEAPVASTAAGKGFVSPGKRAADVSMTHHFSSEPAIGIPLTLEMIFLSGRSDALSLDIHADDALTVKPLVGRRTSSGETVTVQVLPQAEGRYYVNVIARPGGASGAQARVYSVPVQVGKGTYESAARKAETGHDGERLIRMPAEEDPVY